MGGDTENNSGFRSILSGVLPFRIQDIVIIMPEITGKSDGNYSAAGIVDLRLPEEIESK